MTSFRPRKPFTDYKVTKMADLSILSKGADCTVLRTGVSRSTFDTNLFMGFTSSGAKKKVE